MLNKLLISYVFIIGILIAIVVYTFVNKSQWLSYPHYLAIIDVALTIAIIFVVIKNSMKFEKVLKLRKNLSSKTEIEL